MLTIFIRSRNEEALIGLTLERVFTQKTAHKFEVIVLDSASADDTVKIAARFPCRLISIPKNLFTYSAALNYGVSLAQGDFFIPLSAHAVPADEHWLDNLVKPLLSDQHTAATFSRQIGWPDLGTLEKAAINREFQPISFNREITALTESSDLYCTIFFSNVSSCIRISAAKKFPFLEMPYSEDRAFALQLLASGAEIRYVADSVVLHSHPPKFSDFRSVARNATRARRILSLLTEKELKRRFYTPGILKKGLAFIKIPLALLILSLKSAAAIGYRNKLFLCSSIGTTLGKYEGLSGAVKLPATADYTAISANAKIFSTTTELTVTEHRYTDNAENNRIVSDK